MTKPTAEARRHQEESGDQDIGKSGDRKAAHLRHPGRVGADATASRRTPTMHVPEYVVAGSSCEATDLATEALRRAENYRNSVFADHPITRSRAITRSSLIPAAFNRMILIVRAALREIFDESAYDRFLQRTHGSRSIASYREFMRERDAAMLKKPRCC